MHVHTDYEPAHILAAFDSPQRAEEAAARLRSILSDSHAIQIVPLEPGRYQLTDTSLAEEAHGALRGVEVGAPLGALAGAGLATLLIGVGPFAAVGLALAGAIGGFVVGGMTGAITRTRWDRDVAGLLEVPPGSEYALLIVHASASPTRREHSKALRLLRQAGAVAFLDPSAYFATRPELVAA